MWQPIETAPKDGAKVDLWVVDDEDGPHRIVDAYWSEAAWYGISEGRWWAPNRCYDGEDGALGMGETITHWMPLPAPPGADPGIPIHPTDLGPNLDGIYPARTCKSKYCGWLALALAALAIVFGGGEARASSCPLSNAGTRYDPEYVQRGLWVVQPDRSQPARSLFGIEAEIALSNVSDPVGIVVLGFPVKVDLDQIDRRVGMPVGMLLSYDEGQIYVDFVREILAGENGSAGSCGGREPVETVIQYLLSLIAGEQCPSASGHMHSRHVTQILNSDLERQVQINPVIYHGADHNDFGAQPRSVISNESLAGKPVRLPRMLKTPVNKPKPGQGEHDPGKIDEVAPIRSISAFFSRDGGAPLRAQIGTVVCFSAIAGIGIFYGIGGEAPVRGGRLVSFFVGCGIMFGLFAWIGI